MGDHGGDIVSRLSSSSGPSAVIAELGYGCAVTVDYFKEVIGLMPAMDESELARLVGVLARTHSSLDVSTCGATLSSLAAAVGIDAGNTPVAEGDAVVEEAEPKEELFDLD